MRATALIFLLGAGGAQASSLATFEYDEVGRLLRERGADGRVVATYTYDAVGNRTSVADALGNKTTFVRDAFDRVVETIDPAGGITKTTYDSGDRITQVSDPRGLETTYLVDGLGRLVREASPDRGTTSYVRDDAGQVIRMTRANGTWLAYGYDALGRVVSEGNDIEHRRYHYDSCRYGKGRLCTGEVGGDSLLVGYTPHGELALREERIAGEDFGTYFFRDGAGRLTGVVYPDGMQVDYAYESSELRSVYAEIDSQIHAVVTDIRYTPFDGVESWVHGNGLTRTHSRDADGRLIGIGVSDATGARQSLTYQYDAANRITRITNGIEGSHTQGYGYDRASRLMSTSSGDRFIGISYDANGNRTSEWENGKLRNIQIAEQSNQVQTSMGTFGYRHDAAGNRVAQWDGRTDFAYHYDAFNRLARADKGRSWTMVSAQMRTNALDQRTLKDGPAGVHRFIHVGQNQLLAENRPDGWQHYIWMGDALVGVVTPQSALLAVHVDHLGRPEVMTDQAGTTVWRARNDAIARSVTIGSSGDMPLGLPGQYHDDEIWLAFNGYRYLDPLLGSYTQADPLGLADGTNPYAYVSGNPVNLVDPLGLRATCKCTDSGAQININFKFTGDTSAASALRSSIESRWTAPGFTVTTSLGGWFATKINLVPGNGRSFMQGNRGTWYTGEDPWVGAHEAGHIMQLDDRYAESNGKSTPQPGWEGTIMGEHLGAVTPADRQGVLDVLGCNCQCGGGQ